MFESRQVACPLDKLKTVCLEKRFVRRTIAASTSVRRNDVKERAYKGPKTKVACKHNAGNRS